MRRVRSLASIAFALGTVGCCCPSPCDPRRAAEATVLGVRVAPAATGLPIGCRKLSDGAAGVLSSDGRSATPSRPRWPY